MTVMSPAFEDSLTALASDWLNNVPAPGAAIALIIDGTPWTVGVGYSDLAQSQLLAPDARFGLYSITKMLISTMVLQLSEGRDSPSLDDTLQQWRPDLPIDRPMLLRQVLNHTAGLPDYGGLAVYQQAILQHPEQAWSSAEFLRQTLEPELLFMPGHGWRYSNIGYLLLRMLLEDETGLPLPLLIRQWLARPLGLPTLSAAVNLEEMAGLTPGFSTMLSSNGDLENVIPRYDPGWVSHGLAIGTALDVAQFTWLLLGTREVLPSEMVSEMLIGAPVATEHRWFVSPAYGLGLMTDPDNAYGHVSGHTGGGPGYSTAAYHFPNVQGAQVTAVALVNGDGGDFGTDLAFHLVEGLAQLRGGLAATESEGVDEGYAICS